MKQNENRLLVFFIILDRREERVCIPEIRKRRTCILDARKERVFWMKEKNVCVCVVYKVPEIR